MPKFDINALGGGERRPAHEVRWVKLAQIEPNPMNGEIYETGGIDELAVDIELNGLLQFPLVRYMPGGNYRLISGHRRVLALRQLAKKDRAQWGTIPVILDTDKDDTSIAIKLISANAVNRHMSRRERLKQAVKLYELLTVQKKKEGLAGRVRDMVAAKLNISSAAVGEYLQISRCLHQELTEWYLDGEISKGAAVEASKLTPEQQDVLMDAVVGGELDAKYLNAVTIRKYFFAAADVPEMAREESAQASDVPEMAREERTQAADVPEMAHEENAQAADVPEMAREKNTQVAGVPEMARGENTQAEDVPEMAHEENAQTADVPEMAREKYNARLEIIKAAASLVRACREIHSAGGDCNKNCPLFANYGCNLRIFPRPYSEDFLAQARQKNKTLHEYMQRIE